MVNHYEKQIEIYIDRITKRHNQPKILYNLDKIRHSSLTLHSKLRLSRLRELERVIGELEESSPFILKKILEIRAEEFYTNKNFRDRNKEAIKIRKKEGLSQKELGDKLGISEKQITRYEIYGRSWKGEKSNRYQTWLKEHGYTGK